MTISLEILKNYPNKVFTESGTYKGDTVSKALNMGFQKIISIEVDKTLHRLAKDRFRNHDNVEIIHGSSIDVLPNILPMINEDITFWLDGHHSAGETGVKDYYFPIIEEIKVIAQHHRKSHTILVDDVNLFNEKHFKKISERCTRLGINTPSFSVMDIENELLTVNSEYKLLYVDGHCRDSILIGTIS